MVLALLVLMNGFLFQEPHHSLRDQECGSIALLIGELDGVQIRARCSTSNDNNRIMEITVTLDPRPDAGPLEGFTIGFCATPVIDALSPVNWESEVRGGS